MKKLFIEGLGLINPNRMSTGNRKIIDTLIFNMPAGKNGACDQTCSGCYALKAERLYPNVKLQRSQNLYLWHNKRDTLDTLIRTQITYSQLQVIRVHESGDFFSQEYFDFWCDIAESFSDKIFYAYTKSGIDRSEVPTNFNVLSSWAVTGVPNYGTLDECKEWQKMGFYICPSTVTKSVRCNESCVYCHYHSKVVFVKH